MVGISFAINERPKFKILCLGAHADDIEIGCGGTILKFLECHANLEITWVVFSSNPQRSKEAHNSANAILERAASKSVIVKDFQDSFFPYIGKEIKDFFVDLKSEISPDLVFTHYRGDLHQDHRLICELTWNAFRDNLILEYEIPKWDGDLGSPNVYSLLDSNTCRRKVDYLLDYFPSQKSNHWFTEDTFLALLKLRGIEASNQGGYAEAFYGKKIVF